MSYTLTPYLVDLDTLKNAVGGKDEALAEAVIAAGKRDGYVDEDDEPDEEEDEDEIPLPQAIRELIAGEMPHADSSHQYGYALEVLCRHLGERLDADEWEGIRWNVLETTGMDALLEQSGPPVPLPPINDFPNIGHLPADRIREIVANLGDGPPTTAAPSGKKPRRSLRSRITRPIAMWMIRKLIPQVPNRPPLSPDDVRELMEQYEVWLRTAAEKGKSIVFFYY